MGSRVLMGAAALVIGAAGCGGGTQSVALDVTPRSATFDVPFTIKAQGLKPGQRATISLTGTAPDGLRWRGDQRVRANTHGVVLLQDDYLISRMHALGVHGVRTLADDLPQRFEISISAASAAASTTADRHGIQPGSLLSTSERPSGFGFYGQWERPPNVRNHTAVLLFGGSEGGLFDSTLADTLVAHGYPVLHLAYFREPGLPPTLTRIPLEYFKGALRWLARQPAVNPKRIVTFGISRGGELSLILASTFPKLVHAAVGYVPYYVAVGSPSNRRQPAWTLHGKPVMHEIIPVWKSSGPVFVAGGDADALWPSGIAVQHIKAEMLAHNRHDFTALDYSRAGHLLGLVVPMQIPQSPIGYGNVSTQYGELYLGGTPKADENAREDAWPRLLSFLSTLQG